MKILIVDDEIIIRQGLSMVIDWRKLGFELLEPAESAEEALDRLQQEKPDLILTDIRMEGKDGLALAKEARELLPDVEIIMLTGYDDFEYMQRAIRENVSDYLLKSSRPGDIIQAVVSAAQRIRDKWGARSQVFRQEKEMREHLLERWLTGGAAVEEARLAAAFPLLPIGKTPLQVVLLQPTGWGERESGGQLLRFAAENMLREMIPCETLITSKHVTALMPVEGAAWEEKLRAVLGSIEQLLKCSIYGAAGRPAASPNQLPDSYSDAVKTSKYWGLLPDRMLHYRQIEHRKGARTLCSREEEVELAELLSAGDAIRLNQWLKVRLCDYLSQPDLTYESFSSYIQSLALSGTRWFERMSASEAMKESLADFSVARDRDEPALQEKLQQYLHEIMNAYHATVHRGAAAYVRRVIGYIKDNLGSQKMNLHQAARLVHVHPGYLSEVFKRETGSTFNDFLVREKLERARELLSDPAAKISEIARSVGYEDVKYFSQLFKRHYQLTPSEYRERRLGSGSAEEDGG
ncbi:putative response regulatory protein [Paenibacillus konkukensis]|uniref:Response regulatory protein n=1 Tax=Paenibacillus konkukensis TaxID=2020716 RepID=A0ABY4RKC7_9BACL|nr:response regulator [Paenibacillus konkukensis]UQZ82682.1 putative response regulatory protein [Paenibacillus konkukensis]